MTRPPVQQYLVNLATAWANGAGGPVPAPAGLDRPALRAALLAHNVEVPLGALLPDDLRDDNLASHAEASRARSTVLLLEAERILPLVARHAERTLLLKGAALALRTYPEPSQRWFLDLDLLVPRAAVAPVCRELEQAGYRPLPGARDPRFYEKYHLHRILLGPAGACVEVHWDLTLPGSVYRLGAAGVMARARADHLGRVPVWLPTPVDQVLHATYQNIADGYLDLRRVLDLALLLPRLDPEEVDLLVNLARGSGLARGVALTLHMVKSITGVEAPGSAVLEQELGLPGWRLAHGLDLAGGCLERRSRTTEGYAALLHLLATPRGSDRWRETGRFLWVGEERLLDLGHRAGALPGLWGRTRVGLQQAVTLARIGGLAARAFATPQHNAF